MIKKLFFTVLLSITFFSAHALHPDFKLEKNQLELIALYNDYLDSLRKNPEFHSWFPLEEMVITKEIIPHLDIDLSIEEIKEMYKKTGVVQLRKINPKSKTLVICCGNRPLLGEPLHRDEQFMLEHSHDGEITIDPNPRMNPTVLAFFGGTSLKCFSDKSFDKIVIEGMPIEPRLLELKYLLSDIARILTTAGNLYYDFGGYGPFKTNIDEFKLLCDNGNNEEIWDTLSLENACTLPKLFEKMDKEKAKKMFKDLLKNGNWVHKNKTWEKTFSIIAEKVKHHSPGRKSFPEDFFFTDKESRLIRRTAM